MPLLSSYEDRCFAISNSDIFGLLSTSFSTNIRNEMPGKTSTWFRDTPFCLCDLDFDPITLIYEIVYLHTKMDFLR